MNIVESIKTCFFQETSERIGKVFLLQQNKFTLFNIEEEVEVDEHCDINGCLNNLLAVHLFEGSFCKQQAIKSLNPLEAVSGGSGG